MATPKVTAIFSTDFPKLHWAINAGEVKELPEDKKAQALILATDGISLAKDDGKLSGAQKTEGPADSAASAEEKS